MLEINRYLAQIEDEQIRSQMEGVLKQAEQALTEFRPVLTPFFSPSLLQLLEEVLGQVDDLKVLFHGGYQKARRKRLELRPLDYLPALDFHPVLLLEIQGGEDWIGENFLEFLHSLGIEEGSVGDILFLNQGIQLVCIPEIFQPVKKGLSRVYSEGVQVMEIEALQLQKTEEAGREFTTTVASMRLDAIASSGFGFSRSRMKREILLEKVKVNWKVVKDPARSIGPADVISMDGRGRLEILEVLGQSRRGRVKLLLTRYS